MHILAAFYFLICTLEDSFTKHEKTCYFLLWILNELICAVHVGLKRYIFLRHSLLLVFKKLGEVMSLKNLVRSFALQGKSWQKGLQLWEAWSV